MNIDTKKIGTFLKSITDAERNYLTHCLNFSGALRDLIKRHELSKEDVCSRFEIKPSEHDDFVKGNYNYSINEMAILNASFMELESEKLKENAPVKFPENEQ